MTNTVNNSRGTRMYSYLLAALACFALVSSGCGEEQKKPKRQEPGKGRKKGKRRGKGKKKGKALQGYQKVPEDLRHTFTERDFQPDPTGDANRDPFRSYLLARPLSEGDEGSSGDITEICPPERSLASKYSIRSLNLIGIVLRGTRSYALFRDGSGLGHIIRRGDCMGKEKAVVQEIGVGYVTLEVTPEAPQGLAAPPAQTRTIALYPEELSIEGVTSTPSGDSEGTGSDEEKPFE